MATIENESNDRTQSRDEEILRNTGIVKNNLVFLPRMIQSVAIHLLTNQIFFKSRASRPVMAPYLSNHSRKASNSSPLVRIARNKIIIFTISAIYRLYCQCFPLYLVVTMAFRNVKKGDGEFRISNLIVFVVNFPVEELIFALFLISAVFCQFF